MVTRPLSVTVATAPSSSGTATVPGPVRARATACGVREVSRYRTRTGAWASDSACPGAGGTPAGQPGRARPDVGVVVGRTMPRVRRKVSKASGVV